jgi:hypothetical protein|tara:strand:- start:972 stop:1112 length:141 start_codon:yes stop_codon:yes gene_type:complete
MQNKEPEPLKVFLIAIGIILLMAYLVGPHVSGPYDPYENRWEDGGR